MVGKGEGLNIFIPSDFTGKVCCSLPGYSGLCLGPKMAETTHGTEGSNQVLIRSAGHVQVHRTGQDAYENARKLA